MSQWLDINAKYLKGWGSYMLIVFAFHALLRILGVGSFLSLPFQAIGLSERVAGSIGWGICGLASLIVAFYAFRSAVRKFIMHRPE